VTNFFIKYHFLIILVVPLFIAATTLQHSIDLQNFLPADQPATSIPVIPGGEVLDEISSEDDIHSHHVIISHPIILWSDSDYLIQEVSSLNKIVPTPPPDLA